MTRIVGYYVYPNMKEGDKKTTRAGAIKTAREILEASSTLLKAGVKTKLIKTVGIVRANDKTLIMKISLGKKGYIVEKM